MHLSLRYAKPRAVIMPAKQTTVSVAHRRHVVGAEPLLGGSRLGKWLQMDSCGPTATSRSALTIQRAYRLHRERQIQLLANLKSTALTKERVAAAMSIQRVMRGRSARKQLRLIAKVKDKSARKKQFSKQVCKFRICRRPGCRYSHAPLQFQPDAAKFAQLAAKSAANRVHKELVAEEAASPKEASTNGQECAICMHPMELSTTAIGIFASCGHAMCLSCAETALKQQRCCPVCRAETANVLRMRI